MDFQGARAKAEQLAIKELEACGVSAEADVLSVEALEAEGCWIFFLCSSATSSVRTHPGQVVFTAYAVSKTGDVASIYDFREQPAKMNDYLQLWSLQALGQKAEARLALDAFIAKYEPSASGSAT